VETTSSRLSLGWLQGTVERDPAGLIETLEGFFGPAVDRDRGLPWYGRSVALGEWGVKVGWQPHEFSNAEDEAVFVIPQRALDALGWAGGSELARQLGTRGARFSRVDVAFDDLARTADPLTVYEAFTGGQVVAHTRSARLVQDTEGGMTAYLGARSSEAFVRVYRKYAESRDEREGVRWEGEFKGDRAGRVLAAVLGADAPAREFFGILRGIADFREVRRDDVNAYRAAALLPWWAALIGTAERISLAVPVVVSSLAERVQWLHRQAAPTLALAYRRLGVGVLRALLDDGARRVDPRVPDWNGPAFLPATRAAMAAVGG
jgi:hypothetical protein